MRQVKISTLDGDQLVNVPDAPALLPQDLRKKWQDEYVTGYKEAAADSSRGEGERAQHALREANRVLRVTAPGNLDEAKALPEWQVSHREEVEVTRMQGREAVKKKVLKVVTIDGKKYEFAVPKSASTGGAGTQNGSAQGTKTPAA